MELRRAVDATAARLLHILLPLRCLLCGAAGAAGRDLCAGCSADLVVNSVCCPRCAEPLETAAPACGACLRHAPPFASAWAPLCYTHPLDLLEARFKFGRDLAAGRVLAQLLIEHAQRRFGIAPASSTHPVADTPPIPDHAVPERLLCVPLHPRRLRERGYNQALELARPLAAALGIPLDPHCLQRTRHTTAQTGLDAKARRRNLNGAFAVDPTAQLPAHVAVLDDVMTTGATLRECAQVLRRAGVARVDVWALARAP